MEKRKNNVEERKKTKQNKKRNYRGEPKFHFFFLNLDLIIALVG